MKPYVKERCANPGAFYENADEVLADPDLTPGEKEYVLKSMAVDAELLQVVEPPNAAPGEHPPEVTAIHKALHHLGPARSLDDAPNHRAGTEARNRRPFARIVAALAGDGDLDREVLAVAGAIARLSGGEVTFVSVVPPEPGPAGHAVGAPVGGVVAAPAESPTDLDTRLDARRAEVREVLSRAAATPSPHHLEIRHGRVDDEVLRAAEERAAGLIVIGSHDRSWIERLFVPETARQVAETAACPVLVVPGAKEG